MKVMGIDPGSNRTGYAIMEDEHLITSGCIRLAGTDAEKMSQLSGHLLAIIAEHKPEYGAIESMFLGRYLNTDKLAQARGVCLLAMQEAGLQIHEYAPRLVKKAATGRGNAPKELVQAYMMSQYGRKFQTDEADAVAVAMCFMHRYKVMNLGVN